MYHIQVQIYKGKIIERSFETALLRTLFVIGIEGHGLGTVLNEWES